MATEKDGKPEEKKQEQQKVDLIELAKVVAPELKSLIADYFRHREQEGKRVNWVFYSMLAFLILVIGIMAWLTSKGQVSGDALLFLVGTVVGYTMAFMLELARSRWFK
jgi:hypothetical protein